ncbi:Imm26 family immunity protein [Roseiconus lacunae]|uniref:Imm26 family immunity protein n=1 Tax=Roseiconus lacunae TaxID=2605694 RepID=A0ABT7PKU4_9BACT|nr:Imm26 family immunity protein [Roseiconus lacunae]MDM4017090.1 Imm26 family immunity protein [Roseiconus lacunae]
MGWLSTNTNAAGDGSDQSLFYSDSGLDACSDYLGKLAELYRDEFDRRPTLNEIFYHVETGLNERLDELVTDSIDSVSSLTAKTKKRPAKPKAVLGDIVAIPLARHVFVYCRVVEVLKRDDVVVELFDLVTSTPANIVRVVEASALAQFRLEQTGVHWQHWKVIGNQSVADDYVVKKVAYSLPCFVAEIEFTECLQKAGQLPESFRLYADVNASHPKLREDELASLATIMQFLQDKSLLTDEGIAELESGKLPNDFSLHSGLLTEAGNQFYEKVFKKDYQSGYFLTDTATKIEQFWSENQ